MSPQDGHLPRRARVSSARVPFFLSYAECHVSLEVRSPLAAAALLAIVGTAAIPGRTRVLCLLAMEPSASTSTLAISMLRHAGVGSGATALRHHVLDAAGAAPARAVNVLVLPARRPLPEPARERPKPQVASSGWQR